MLALTVAVGLSLIISACCSVTEAILYSVPWSHVEQLRKSGRKAGQVLFELRSRIEQPITAVLTLNTVANTAGAAIAGAYAAEVLGDANMAAFAAGFTVLVLILGEIIPKTIGVAHARTLSEYVARPIRVLVVVLMPVIWLGGRITRLFTPPGGGAPHATEDDIRAIVSLSRRAGRIQPYEELSIRNILSLDQKRVHEIMTPRTVVFSLPAAMTVADAVRALLDLGLPLVEITGGEPLLAPETPELVAALADAGLAVLVETNGSLDISRLDPRAVAVMDVKCPGSGMEGRNDYANLERLRPRDEVKFVLADRADYDFARGIAARVRGGNMVHFSPVPGRLDAAALAAWMVADRVRARLSLQLHKYIWSPDARGV